MKNTSFTFHTPWVRHFRQLNLTDAEIGALLRYCCNYAETGDFPAFSSDLLKAIFVCEIKDCIDCER